MNKNDFPLLHCSLLVAERTLVLMDFSSIFQIVVFFCFVLPARQSPRSAAAALKGKQKVWSGQNRAQLTPSKQAQKSRERKQQKVHQIFIEKHNVFNGTEQKVEAASAWYISRISDFHCDDDTRRCWAHLAAQHTREKLRWNFFHNEEEIKNNEISSNCWTELWIIKKPNFIIFHICETTDKVCGLELCNMIEINYPVNQFSMLLKQPSSRLYSCLVFFFSCVVEKKTLPHPPSTIISPRFSHEGARFFFVRKIHLTLYRAAALAALSNTNPNGVNWILCKSIIQRVFSWLLFLRLWNIMMKTRWIWQYDLHGNFSRYTDFWLYLVLFSFLTLRIKSYSPSLNSRFTGDDGEEFDSLEEEGGNKNLDSM